MRSTQFDDHSSFEQEPGEEHIVRNQPHTLCEALKRLGYAQVSRRYSMERYFPWCRTRSASARIWCLWTLWTWSQIKSSASVSRQPSCKWREQNVAQPRRKRVRRAFRGESPASTSCNRSAVLSLTNKGECLVEVAINRAQFPRPLL